MTELSFTKRMGMLLLKRLKNIKSDRTKRIHKLLGKCSFEERYNVLSYILESQNQVNYEFLEIEFIHLKGEKKYLKLEEVWNYLIKQPRQHHGLTSNFMLYWGHLDCDDKDPLSDKKFEDTLKYRFMNSVILDEKINDSMGAFHEHEAKTSKMPHSDKKTTFNWKTGNDKLLNLRSINQCEDLHEVTSKSRNSHKLNKIIEAVHLIDEFLKRVNFVKGFTQAHKKELYNDLQSLFFHYVQDLVSRKFMLTEEEKNICADHLEEIYNSDIKDLVNNPEICGTGKLAKKLLVRIKTSLQPHLSYETVKKYAKNSPL